LSFDRQRSRAGGGGVALPWRWLQAAASSAAKLLIDQLRSMTLRAAILVFI
jgi:hypothetical protein